MTNNNTQCAVVSYSTEIKKLLPSEL